MGDIISTSLEIKRMKKKALTNQAGVVRELTCEDIRNMASAEEVLPPELVAILPKRKRAKVSPRNQG